MRAFISKVVVVFFGSVEVKNEGINEASNIGVSVSLGLLVVVRVVVVWGMLI